MSEISVVICVKNAETTLKKAMDSLIKNRYKEIVVIDGNSTDNTLKIARKYTDKIFSDEGKGLGYARQLGAKKSIGKYVAYVDSDTELSDKNTLTEMLNELKNRNWVAIHAQMIDPRDDKSYWEEGENFHWVHTFNKPGEKDHLGTIVCIFRRDILLKYKFDLSFSGAAEDADLYARLKMDGHEFGVSEVIAYHYHRATFDDFKKQRIWYGKGNARAIIKHKAVHLIIVPFAIVIYGTLLSLYNKKPKMIPFYFIWMIYLFYGTISGLKTFLIN